MQKLSVFILILAGLTFKGFAQSDTKFVFENNPRAWDASALKNVEIHEHPMGNDVARLMALLKQRYTYVEAATPTSPHDKLIIIKPGIYNSIQKLNRYYKKVLKSNPDRLEEAREEFILCLKIALLVYTENTDDFEEYLRKCRKPDQILAAYNMVELQ